MIPIGVPELPRPERTPESFLALYPGQWRLSDVGFDRDLHRAAISVRDRAPSLRFLRDFETKTVAIISVDPTKKRTGGALLGDRIRMNAISSPRVYMRSLATRSSTSELSDAIGGAIRVCQAAGYDLIIVESAGIGQKDAAIAAISEAATERRGSLSSAACKLRSATHAFGGGASSGRAR